MPTTQYVMTAHASARVLDMRLEPNELEDAINKPAITWPDRKYGTQMHTRGRVTASLKRGEDGVLVVLTVLWSSDELWRQSYVANPVDDRPARF
jgi:hypothetical protein